MKSNSEFLVQHLRDRLAVASSAYPLKGFGSEEQPLDASTDAENRRETIAADTSAYDVTADDISDPSVYLISAQARTEAALRALSHRFEAWAIDSVSQWEKAAAALRTLHAAVTALSVKLDVGTAHLEGIVSPLMGAIHDVSEKLDRSVQYLVDVQRIEASTVATSITQVAAKIDNSTGYLASRQHGPVIPIPNRANVVQVDGFIVAVPPTEWRTAAYLAYRGPLEPGLLKFLERHLRPGSVFVDVGANFGAETLHAARCLNGRGAIYSLEPAPETFKLLGENIQINGYLESGLITTSQLAAADKRGRVQFHIYDDDSGHNTFYPEERYGRTVEVETAPLDEVIPPTVRVDVIKIDVEGAEPLVWRGMRRIVAENEAVCIVLEFAPINLRRAGVAPEEFLQEIAADGFDIEVIDALTGETAAADIASLPTVHSVNICLSRVRRTS